MALSVKQQALTRGKFDDFHQADDMRITSYALRYYLNTPESNCPASFPVDATTRIQKSGASWPVGKWKTDVESDLKGINRFGSRVKSNSVLYNPDTNKMKMQQGSNALIGNANRYGNFAMEHLINTILSNGGKRKNLEVKVFGGGKIIPTLSDVGERNIEFVMEYIDQEGLLLLSKDLGDIYPRKVIYFPQTGKVGMKKIQDLHHDAIAQRERQYLTNIKDLPIEGDVELF